MFQVGRVLQVEGEYALVHMEKKSGCGGERCPLSSSLIDDSQSDFYTVCARNEIHASPGDIVLVAVRDQVVLTVAFLLYIVPILFALSAYALIRFFTPHEPLAILGLCGSLGGSFLLLRKLNRRFVIEYRVVDRVSSKECSVCPLLLQSRR